MPNSTNAPDKGDEMLMKQFKDSFKDLKNLKKQLYSAAHCLESSYIKHNHKHFVVESSKEYVTKAVVSTVDHLGSVAHKINKLVDEKADQFSATIIQLSLIQQKLSTVQGFVGFSSSTPTAKFHKQYRVLPAGICPTSGSHESNSNCVSSNQENPFWKGLETQRMELVPPLLGKEDSRKASPNPQGSYSNRSKNKMLGSKEAAGRRSVSPLRFLRRAVSPTPSVNKRATQPRRAISAGRRTQHHPTISSTQREMEESYTKRSSHMFKALLTLRN